MSGYTPIFDTVFNGTLCGRWPALPVWLSLLPLADWRGHIDMTPEAIASRTGWPMDLLMQGIDELTQPDDRSRSKDEGGRRLVLIDADTSWGWKVVNIHKYRQKASARNQVEDGRNAEKVRKYKERRNQQTPQDTSKHQGDTHSYSDSYSDKNKDIHVVFDHWRVVHGHRKAQIDAKRTKLIRDALKLYSAEDLKRCIDGYKRSAWHQGKNDRKQVYDDIGLLLRDAQHIDAGLKSADGGVIEWM